MTNISSGRDASVPDKKLTAHHTAGTPSAVSTVTGTPLAAFHVSNIDRHAPTSDSGTLGFSRLARVSAIACAACLSAARFVVSPNIK
ncbi:hypothetical protein [Rhizobium sp. SEMIA 4088]|uniref:hypothetical protein n=1 Tax=Rhizobium sp. SEMIA 4088 TaxID=2137763 RepID=UPI001FDA854F|nr:hypothetical protein [Rhizobium sp. SEMIA 4088]